MLLLNWLEEPGHYAAFRSMAQDIVNGVKRESGKTKTTVCGEIDEYLKKFGSDQWNAEKA